MQQRFTRSQESSLTKLTKQFDFLKDVLYNDSSITKGAIMNITEEQLRVALVSSSLFYYDKDYGCLQFGYTEGSDIDEEIQKLLILLNNIKE